ncbi:hypothetical protein ETU10_02630 [Apibacter muscae]|uniref:hypothetical protein n=1 Tax=Apibacter muscae TaxID=2509004 RepID=UPI0011ADBE38|nr:hypothetical protein [Apibacter muscae]TWP24875.1 hypothetical protein ETU10_02630 [Apibacter muscae]
MKKKTLINLIAIGIGIYFIYRGIVWYNSNTDENQPNKFIGFIYMGLGILAILVQVFANYRSTKRKDK